MPDPLVLQAASRYCQARHWHLARAATLLLAYWWHAGRTDAGEKFAFTTFATELRVRVAGRLALHQLPPAGQTELHARLAGRPAVVAVTQARANVVVVRALGLSRHDLEPAYQALAVAAAVENCWTLTFCSENTRLARGVF